MSWVVLYKRNGVIENIDVRQDHPSVSGLLGRAVLLWKLSYRPETHLEESETKIHCRWGIGRDNVEVEAFKLQPDANLQFDGIQSLVQLEVTDSSGPA